MLTLAAVAPFERHCLGQRGLFEFEARVKIQLSRIHGFMPQPQGNDGTIDTALKQIHRGAVAPMPLAQAELTQFDRLYGNWGAVRHVGQFSLGGSGDTS